MSKIILTRFLSYIFFSLVVTIVYGQNKTANVQVKLEEFSKSDHSKNDKNNYKLTNVINVPFKTPLKLFAFSVKIQIPAQQSNQIHIDYKVLNKNSGWTDWLSLSEDSHDFNEELYSTSLAFIRRNDTKIKFKITGIDTEETNVDVFFINLNGKDNPINKDNQNTNAKKGCAKPNVLPRSTYLEPDDEKDHWTPNYTTVTHAVIHHADWSTSTELPTWPEVAYAVWHLHRKEDKSNGEGPWADIAYNYLIDPDGNIYKGRAGEDNVLGASLCSYHNNTVSVCMLGDYHSLDNYGNPTPSQYLNALNPKSSFSLTSILAWKLDKENIDPLTSSNLPNFDIQPHIMGHTDGCQTSCPGDNIYNQLDNIRTQVAAKIKGCQLFPAFICKKGCIDLNPNCPTLNTSFDDNKITFSNLSISNNSPGISESFQIGYYLSSTSYVTNNSYLIGTQNMSGFAPNSSVIAPTTSFSLNGIPANNYYVITVVDYQNVNGDVSYENNDCFTTTTVSINMSNPASSCFDNIQNQGETGVDCGGPCIACASCFDSIQNQGENDIDCGGPCVACASCFDNFQNQGETGIDCGGPCVACASCFDNFQNQGETGIDCGGPCIACASCFDNFQNQGENGIDCGGPCVACASCFDNFQNQRETGIDCGGPCIACPTCNDNFQNQGETGIDCGGPCIACPTCNDNIQNQNETGIDCGGVCGGACLPEGCNAPNSYVNGYPTNKYEAKNFLISPYTGEKATVSANTKASFDAGDYIDLNPGFTAEYNSRFDAFIDGCGGISDPKIKSVNNPITLSNYPNPFSGETTIAFELPKESKVTLFVTDMMGKTVTTLLDNELQNKGVNTITFKGNNYPPGMYYYTIQAGDNIATQKMILME